MSAWVIWQARCFTETWLRPFFNRPNVQHLRNLHVLSETTTYSAWMTLRREEGLVAPVGHPISNTRIYVLDGEG